MFNHLRLSFDAVTEVFLCKNCVKYQYARREVCAYSHVFLKQSGCAFIGACALIRKNMVLDLSLKQINSIFAPLLIGLSHIS